MALKTDKKGNTKESANRPTRPHRCCLLAIFFLFLSTFPYFFLVEELGNAKTFSILKENHSDDTFMIPHAESKLGNVKNAFHHGDDGAADEALAPPEYIFGFSTGHAGSTSLHSMLLKAKGCPWGEPKGKFEKQGPRQDQQNWTLAALEDNDAITNSSQARCKYTQEVLIPFLSKKIGKHLTTWIDLGHYHNRGFVLECLAEILGTRVAFVRIRRNRHDIARSFVLGSKMKSPCIPKFWDRRRRKRGGPWVSYCSMDGPVALPVANGTWFQLDEFQKFLWMVDEMEIRFHNLQKRYPSCRYHEITWSRGSELMDGFQRTLGEMGCSVDTIGQTKLAHFKSHVKHDGKLRNCSNSIIRDVQYRHLMQYKDEIQKILYHKHPQYIHLDQCNESKEEILELFRTFEGEDWRVSEENDIP